MPARHVASNASALLTAAISLAAQAAMIVSESALVTASFARGVPQRPHPQNVIDRIVNGSSGSER